MASQGSYPLNGRVPAGSDTATGVVAGATADIPLADIARLVAVPPATTTTLGLVQPDGTTITVTPDGIVTATPATASSVGLGNVDNTSDANKPVSTAQQAALNLKANVASPMFTGTGGLFVNDGGVPVTVPGLPVIGLTTRRTPPISTSGVGANSTVGMYGWTASGATNCPGFTAGRSFGTPGLQGAVTANHDLFSLNGAASDGTDFQLCASIVMSKAAGTTTPTDSAGMVRFFVTPVGSVLPVEVVRILSSGEVGINTTAATADKLNVNGSVRFGAALLGQFTLSTLPSAASFSGYTIDVTNATGGPKQCRSNGTNWLITNTSTPVS